MALSRIEMIIGMPSGAESNINMKIQGIIQVIIQVRSSLKYGRTK